MNNLDLELWKKVEETYPEEMKLFKVWIDKYKKEVNWNSLLGINLKFHDLPFEMQLGVLSRYQSQIENNGKEFEEMYDRRFEGVKELFEEFRNYKINEIKS